MQIPMVKIRFTPRMSAILPMGTRNMAAARKKAVGSQLISTELMENSIPMVGMATMRAETMKGAMNDPPAEIMSRYLFSTLEVTLQVN